MELRHLRYFVALADCLNFTRAAERVHVTQSTLSHQIRQLEDEVGQQLVERSGRRVALTPPGELFLESARRALAEMDQALGAMKDTDSAFGGEIRIGTTHTFNLRFIPECVAAFLTRHPTARVQVMELAADQIASGLQEGSLDLGISYQPADVANLWFEPLYSEEMALVVGLRHPFAQRRRVRMVELHRLPIVTLPASYATRLMLDGCFRACGAEPLVAAEMNTVAPMLALAERTQIGAIVAANAVPEGMNLKVVPLESPTPVRTPGILWKRGGRQSTQLRAFSAIVRKAAINRSLSAGVGRA